MLFFQDIILRLQQYWASKGCIVLQPYDMEVGAGTSHPATVLRSLGHDTWKTVYVQPSRRPTDGRFGQNPNRTQLYYQLQVILKPAPVNSQELYLESLYALGLDPKQHDLRFVEDDWENPSLGASGLGWEIWCDGLEISQYTYFQQVGGLPLDVVPAELTYGLERIAAFIQNVESHFDIRWNENFTYRDVFLRNEVEMSHYNFHHANVDVLFQHFKDAEAASHHLLQQKLALPAYEQCLKANHLFNLLDARGVISATERAEYIQRIRALAKGCCETYLEVQA